MYELVVAKNGPKLTPAKSDGVHVFRISHGSFEFRNTSLHELAARLSDLPSNDRPVVDRTGIQGVFDIAMTGGARPLTDSLRDQLGLELEAQRGAVDMLVVDHAENLSIRN